MSYFSRSGITYARFGGTRRDISASTTAAASTAISSGVYLLCIHNLTSERAFVRVNDGTAASVTTTNGFPIGAGEYHYLECTPGQTVSAILEVDVGTVAVCEMVK